MGLSSVERAPKGFLPHGPIDPSPIPAFDPGTIDPMDTCQMINLILSQASRLKTRSVGARQSIYFVVFMKLSVSNYCIQPLQYK